MKPGQGLARDFAMNCRGYSQVWKSCGSCSEDEDDWEWEVFEDCFQEKESREKLQGCY